MVKPFGVCKPFLILALIAFSASGCAGKNDVSRVDIQRQAFDDLRSEIRVAIDDTVRETEIIELVDALESELEALNEKLSARKIRAKQLNSNYDTTRAEFEAFFEQANDEIRSHRKRAGNNHRAILSLTTSAEWSQISAARTKAMKTFIKTSRAT